MNNWKETWVPVLTFPSGLVMAFISSAPASQPFLREQTQSAGYLERILTYSGFRFGNSESSVPPSPPEVRCGSILMFYCPDERAGGKDRLGFVEWGSQKINVAESTSRDGVHLTFTACLSIFSSLEWKMGLLSWPPCYSKSYYGCCCWTL